MDVDSELCSPKKIRKLDSPSRGNLQKLSQGSQVSQATSTPIRRNSMRKLSMSSTLSSIARESVGLKNSGASDGESITSELLSGIEELSLNGGSTTTVSYPRSEILNKAVLRGKTWGLFKPKYPESLYAKLFNNFDDLEEIVFEYLEILKIEENKGSLILIKLFVDLSGYQAVTIDEHIVFSNFSVSCEKLIKKLEFEFVTNEMIETKHYLYREVDKHTKLGETLAAIVRSFMEKVFIGAYCQNILFLKIFHEHIAQFLHFMCQSVLRSIRHTGVTLVRVILSVLNYIYPKIFEKLEIGEGGSNELLMRKEIEYLEKYIQHFYSIFAKNSFISDPKLFNLKVSNVKEMGNWMLELPQIYFSHCMPYLLKLQFDKSEQVRINTIRVFKGLIKTEGVQSHISGYLDDIVKSVKGRLQDFRLKVVVAAINFFSVLLDRFPTLVTEEITSAIIEYLYANSYLYGKAAASFTIKFCGNLNDRDILKKFVNISSIPKFQNMKVFFVESFKEHHTVLDNYKLMIEVLLSCNIENADERVYASEVIELMYYSIHQKLKGEPLMKRHQSAEKGTVFGHEEVAKVLLLNITDFLDHFRGHKIVLNYLLKILLVIDYEDLASSYYNPLITLIKSCTKLFLSETDEEILENLSKLYHYFCFEKKTCIAGFFQEYLANLFENLNSYLQQYLEPEKNVVDLTFHFMRIGALYRNFNINSHFDWNSLFSIRVNSTLCKGQMVSCQSHIIWTVKNLIRKETKEDPQYRIKKINLINQFSNYTSTIVQMVASSEIDNALKMDAFESFCLLHLLTYKNSMEDEDLLDFRSHIMKNLKTYFPKELVKFFGTNIVQNETIPYEIRKKMICTWLSLVLNSFIDVFHLIPLFELYHSRSGEYEELVDYVAAAIFGKKPELFFQIILATVIKVAKYVFHTSCRSLLSPEGRELMALTKKFANMIEFSNASSEVLKMLNLGFEHCFHNGIFELLVLFQNFLPKLSEQHYKECLEKFNEATPKEFMHKNYVVTFINKLKAGKPKLFSRPANKSTSCSDVGTEAESMNSPVKNLRTSIPKDKRKSLNAEENDENKEPKTPKRKRTPKPKKK